MVRMLIGFGGYVCGVVGPTDGAAVLLRLCVV